MISLDNQYDLLYRFLLMDKRSRSRNFKVCILYFEDDMILKICGEFSVIYFNVDMVYKEMVLIMKPFSGNVLNYM